MNYNQFMTIHFVNRQKSVQVESGSVISWPPEYGSGIQVPDPDRGSRFRILKK